MQLRGDTLNLADTVGHDVKLPEVVIVLALHKPDPGHLAAQIASLLAQKGVALEVIAVFDGDETALDRRVVEMVSAARFRSLYNKDALGARAAFASGLAAGLKIAPSNGTFFGYADQDDIWYPDKLSQSVVEATKPGVSLVHCDARVVGAEGEELSASLHRYEGRRQHANLFGAVLLNSVTGMTALFPRRTAELALELMLSYKGELLHDHVTSVAAACLGRSVFIDRPLVDYRQHATNHVGAKKQKTLFRSRQVGMTHVRSYRQTSRRIYYSRQELCRAMDHAGTLPADLAAIFRLRTGFSMFGLSKACLLEAGALLLAVQLRRFFLAIRIFDASLTLDTSPPKLADSQSNCG